MTMSSNDLTPRQAYDEGYYVGHTLGVDEASKVWNMKAWKRGFMGSLIGFIIGGGGMILLLLDKVT